MSRFTRGLLLVTGLLMIVITAWFLINLLRPTPTPELAPRKTLDIPDRMKRLAYNIDGKVLAVSYEKEVTLWDIESGEKTRTLNGGGGYFLSFSSDGKWLAAAQPKNSKNIDIWNVESGTALGPIAAHDEYADRLAFSPSELLLATLGFDEEAEAPRGSWTKVKLWEIRSEGNRPVLKVRAVLKWLDFYIKTFDFSADGKTLAIAGFIREKGQSKGVVRLVNVANQQIRRTVDLDHEVRDIILLSPDEKFVALTDGFVTNVWSVETGQKTGKCEDVGMYDPIYSPDGQYILFSSSNNPEPGRPGLYSTIKVRNTRNLQEEFTRQIPRDLYVKAFSPDGKTLATGGSKVRFWDWDTLQNKSDK